MKKREALGAEEFNFTYEEKPTVDGGMVNIKTDFTIYTKDNTWYWEHLGKLGQRKYTWTWHTLKTKTYKEAGIWDKVITTDERNGVNPAKIEILIDSIAKSTVGTEDKYNQYSLHHFYLR